MIELNKVAPTRHTKNGYMTEQVTVSTARLREFIEVSENVEALSLRELVELQFAYTEAAEQVKASLAAINVLLDAIKTRLVPDKMTQDGVRTATFEGIGRVQLRSDMYIHTPADKREDMYQWLREHGLEVLITETVNASTLKATLKERLKQGDTLPDPDVVKITPVIVSSIVKA